MMKKNLTIIFVLVSFNALAQEDSTALVKVLVHQDYRMEILARKQAEINLLAAKMAQRTAMGYRLQVLSTNDRDLAMKTRTQLLQRFPEQKSYMFFQAPYIKLKFGNFRTKQEAETYKKLISKMMGGASIYFLSERIEVKPGDLDEEQ